MGGSPFLPVRPGHRAWGRGSLPAGARGLCGYSEIADLSLFTLLVPGEAGDKREKRRVGGEDPWAQQR